MASKASEAAGPQTGPGPAGKPVVDPTANVLALVEAAVRRLDDLRHAEARRLDNLREAESARIDEVVKLRAYYETKLGLAESARIDAIRAVDVNAVAIRATEQAAAASVLANEVTKSAETLRTLVTAADTKVAQQIAQLAQQVTDRIALLEKSQYQISGRSGGFGAVWGWLVGAVGVAASIVTVAVILLKE